MELSRLVQLAAKYPKPDEFTPSYGTAGFRALAELLPSTVFRCGAVMAAKSLKTGAATGLVITASHNPEADNGLKLMEPTGYMLEQSWEVHANRLAQAKSAESFCAGLQDLFQAEGIPPQGDGNVFIAHDTRPSGVELALVAREGVAGAGGRPFYCGLLTTPQLHWMVRQHNAGLPCGEGDYYAALSAAFNQLVAGTAPSGQVLYVDCANGVGAGKLEALGPLLRGVAMDLRNMGSSGGSGGSALNHQCGADFLQKERVPPCGFEDVPPNSRCASIDGDADRLVYFSSAGEEGGSGFTLMDGDKIAALAALLLRQLLDALPEAEGWKVGIVQTAYANGSSTAYIRDELGLSVACTPTGVKHLHEEAVKFDIGIYFEANGHGTLLFGLPVLQRLHQLAEDSPPARDLLALSDMVNQAVGDALSGILLVETALRRLGWGLRQWAGLYEDLPSRQLKVRVADRGAITTTDAETRVAAPAGLQKLVDAAVRKAHAGRAFVRPSGTEDVVRVYAEARSQGEADVLALQVAQHVYDEAGGIGPRPE